MPLKLKCPGVCSLLAFPNVPSKWRLVWPVAAIGCTYFLGSPSLSREGEFAGWVALLQSGHLAVLHGELIDDVGELRGPELETLYRNQLQRRSARKGQRQPGSGLIEHLKSDFGRSYVPTRESFEQCRVQGIRLARKDDFGLIE